VYEVRLERAAEEFRQIVAAIKALANDPRPLRCRKISDSQHDWRIRVGTFRVVYEIDDKAKIVRVMRVRRRAKAY
jgi:mRNA interferase RelE/StbE